MRSLPAEALILCGMLLATGALSQGSNAPSEMGRELFETRGCAACHTVGGPAAAGKLALDSFRLNADPLFLGAALWNHAPLMLKASGPTPEAWPRFEPGEIERLAEYIHAATGAAPLQPPTSRDASAGSLLFEQRCAACHRAGTEAPAPDLARWLRQVRSRADIAGLMWNHAPAMLPALRQAGREFPRFSGREMADLFSFLLSATQDKALGEEFLFPPAPR
jgi:mono/diheme cytochrome c family protein